jgi:hypothetical protein
MIKTITLLGLCSLCAIAQSSSGYLVAHDGSAIDSQLVSLDRRWEDPQGIHFAFTNHYSKPITALFLFVARYDASGQQRGQAVRTFDSLINRTMDTPIEANGQRVITIGQFKFKVAESHKSEMAAVVFSDGTTSGDPRAIQIIQNMRKAVAQTLPAVIDILQQAQTNGSGRDTVITRLNAYQKEASSNVADKYAGGVPGLVVGEAVDNLDRVDPAQPAQLNTTITRLIGTYTRWLAMLG